MRKREVVFILLSFQRIHALLEYVERVVEKSKIGEDKNMVGENVRQDIRRELIRLNTASGIPQVYFLSK